MHSGFENIYLHKNLPLLSATLRAISVTPREPFSQSSRICTEFIEGLQLPSLNTERV